MGSEMRCNECASMMVLATRSREIETYRCPRGCNGSYRTVINAPVVDGVSLPGTQQNGLPAVRDSAVTVVIH